MNTITIRPSVKKELEQYIYDNIDNYKDSYMSDLHHHLFNEDYYIVYYSEAEKWLKKHNISPFEAIEEIKCYENDNFGEVNTDFSSSENVVNMYVYIKGEEALYNLKSYQNNQNSDLLTKEIIDAMKEELS